VGEFDIQLGRLQRAFGLHLGGMRGLQGLAALVDAGFGDGAGRNQGQRALELALRQFRLGARIGQLAVGLQRDRLERTGIDDIEQVAGFDEVAVAELDGVDEAADAGTDLDLLHRLETAGELVPIGDDTLGRLRDGNGRCWRRRSLRRGLAAAGKPHGEQDSQRRKTAQWFNAGNLRLG
jgi:hypothetical protein